MTATVARDPQKLIAIALSAARDAAALVHAGFRTHPRAELKGPLNLVTRYDKESETLLRARLAPTAIPVVGEEQGGAPSLAPGEATWFVDPIDGTTNFVHGHPFYCVSIGLVAAPADGGPPGPVLGVVVAPALGLEWVGMVGDGATRSGEKCRVSSVVELGDALLATGFPYDRNYSPDNNFDAFVSIKRRCQAVRRCGSAAIDLCLVGDGTYDGYWERRLSPWDLAGGAAVVLAGGGNISGFDGAPADLLAGHVLATNGLIHAAIVDALANGGTVW